MYTDSQLKQLVKDYLDEYLNRCESLRSLALVRYESEEQQQITAATDAQVSVDTSVKAIDDLIAARKRQLPLYRAYLLRCDSLVEVTT